MLKIINNFLQNFDFTKKFYYLYFFIFFILIFLQSYSSILTTWFYADHRLIEHLHNFSKNKNIFDILVNPQTINGLPFTLHNPSLNFLGFLNYNLDSYLNFQIYIIIIRTLEFTLALIYIYFFTKKIKFNLIYIIIFLIAQTTFSVFDHHSYIVLPILIFQFFLIISLFFRNNYFLFCIINFIGTFWSFFINPMYFFIVCFGPLAFFYLYFFLKKEYKTIFILFVINFPFALLYSLLVLGTSRFNLSIFLLPVEGHYNFSIYTGKLFILLSIITIIYFYLKKIKNYEILIFTIFIFFSLIVGLFYKYEFFKWLLPSPNYFDYALKCIYLSIFMIVGNYLIKSNLKIYYFLLFFIIFFIKFFSISENFLNFNNTLKKEFNYKYADLFKRFYWEKNDPIFLSNYKNKTIYAYLPNKHSEYINYILPRNENFDSRDFKYGFSYKAYNKKFKHSLNDFDFHKGLIVVNFGHSLLMDSSTILSNMNNYNELHPKEHVPLLHYKSFIIKNIYKPDYIFSDLFIDDLQIEQIYNFKDYKFYLYIYPKDKNTDIDKVIEINNFKNYTLDSKEFNKNLYVLNKNNIPKNISFCDVIRDNSDRFHLNFKIFTLKQKTCIAILPIPYSNNNLFISKNGQMCKTFRVQYFFHGCLFNHDDTIQLKKNNIFYYAINSLKDFFELKKLNII
jgi:hypothetical protein